MKYVFLFLLLWQTANAQIKAFGDSNTDYVHDGQATKWVHLAGLATKMTVSNYAIAGSTIYYGPPSRPEAGFVNQKNYAATSPKNYAVVMYGTNDVFHFAITPQWKSDYKSYIEYILNQGYSPNKLILISPPNYQPNQIEPYKSRLELVHQYCTEISEELGIRYVDFYQKTKDDPNGASWNDGIHMNSTGNAKLAELVTTMIQQNVSILPVRFINLKLIRK